MTEQQKSDDNTFGYELNSNHKNELNESGDFDSKSIELSHNGESCNKSIAANEQSVHHSAVPNPTPIPTTCDRIKIPDPTLPNTTHDRNEIYNPAFTTTTCDGNEIFDPVSTTTTCDRNEVSDPTSKTTTCDRNEILF